MSVKIPLPIVVILLLGALCIQPVSGQFIADESVVITERERLDRVAISQVLAEYEAAFNSRDIDRRMVLCLDTYNEFGFENGTFLQERDFRETWQEVGRYWESIRSLEYSMDPVEITVDGPQAFVRAHTTHLAGNDRHSSIVYFSLVKLDRQWWIAWDSYNITRRFE